MKKWILILFIIFGLKSNAQNSIPRFVKLTLTEIKSIETEFNWHDENILVINFITPINFSNSDYEKNITQTIDYWSEFYKNVDLKNTKKEFVYSDCVGRNQMSKNNTIHIDKNEIIRNIFFPKDKTCSAIVILNKNGNFKILTGKYNQQEITDSISEMKN